MIGNPRDYIVRKLKHIFLDSYDATIPIDDSSDDELRVSAFLDAINEENKTESYPEPGSKLDINPKSLDSDTDQYMPIFGLNNFVFDWLIKVRVTRKYDLREWKNSMNSGQVLKVEMMDARGDMIEGSFFNQLAMRFDKKVV